MALALSPGLPASAAEPITIYFFQRGYVAGGASAATRLTDAALKGFARRFPDIHVKTIGLPWTREGDLKLRAVLLNRRKIDCFRVTNDQLPAFIPKRGRLLSPIDDRLTEEDFEDLSPGSLDAVRHNGKIMAWPLWSTALALIGNTEIMGERGIEAPAPGRPWSWDEFMTNLGRATFTNAAGKEVWGLTAAARPPLFEWSPLIWAHAGSLFATDRGGDAGGASSESIEFAPNVARALAHVAEIRRLGLVPPSFGIDDQPAVQAQFLSGRATFILTSPGFIRTLASRDFPYAIFPPPLGEFGRPITTGALGCFAVVDHPDDAARTEAAHMLARYLTSAEVAEDAPGWYLAAPARRSVKSFAANPAYKGLMEIARTAVYMNPPGGTGFLEQTLIPKLQAALLGELTPDEALEQIRAAHERMTLR